MLNQTWHPTHINQTYLFKASLNKSSMPYHCNFFTTTTMAVTSIQNPPPAYVETVDEIMGIYRSLPPRPTIEEVEAAMTVVKSVDSDEQLKLDEISKQQKPPDVPEELFHVLQDVKKNKVLLQGCEQRREALYVVDLEKLYEPFDDLIQRASLLVFGDTTHDQKKLDLGSISKRKTVLDLGSSKSGRKSSVLDLGSKSERKTMVMISDESLIKRNRDEGIEQEVSKGLVHSFSLKDGLSSGTKETKKLSLMKVAGIIETSAKEGAGVLDLQGKLMDQIEWLPQSIGKLSKITELNLSENQIMALPTTIGNLTALTKFDIHSNQLVNLPDSFMELVNLTHLELHGNRLRSLPASFGNLTNLVDLDLSSNLISLLPDSLAKLTCLKRLNVETNELEELPYTIGTCSSLTELRLDFNHLKALPEAIGKLECLEILTLHYNRIKSLPTTIGNLSKLRELDVSFNELELIPENLCLATNLVKLYVGNNFADLTALPRSIGNLEMLEVLNISNNQIRILPDSFRFLSKLRVLDADETPLEVPPRQVTKLGAQEVVKYMADLVAMKDVRVIPTKKKGFWYWFCSIFRYGKRNSTRKD